MTRDPNFMKFWVGQSISVFGAQFSPLAIQVIAIQILDVTNFQLGVLGFLNTVPFLVLGLFVGVWLDRHSKRRTLLFADLGRSMVLFAIPVSYWLYALTANPIYSVNVSLLYAVTLLAGVLTVFFEIGYQAYVPVLVERQKIAEANSKLEATRSLSQAAGPFAAGGVIALVGAPLAVLGDTLGYVGSWFSLLLIHKPEAIQSGPRKSTWTDIKEGLSVVFKDSRLRAITSTTATSNLFNSAFGVVLVKFMLVDLGMSTPQVGFVFGIGSLGGVVGAVTAMRVAKRLGVGISIITGAIVFSLLSTLFYFATPGNGIYLSAAILFFSFIGVLIYNIAQVSYRQALVPTNIQGRMNASIRTLVWGIIPVGSLLGGVVAQSIGVRETVVLMALLGMIAPLWIVFSPVRGVREFPKE
ncbi:MAG: MFS transporter [Thaumarchaeota archaeon]|nr:MFS transporter [Nitrososphaerota archaeon]